MFKRMTPEEQEAAAREKAAAVAEKEARKREQREARERAAYLASPVGQAEAAFERGDRLFQYAHDVMSQEAIIVSMVGSTTRRTSSDASEVLNAVCAQGWELVNGSFVFITEGEQSRDKFLSSGQNVAVKGRTVGYYLFRRAPENRQPAVP